MIAEFDEVVSENAMLYWDLPNLASIDHLDIC
jgi:hypothetical protein